MLESSTTSLSNSLIISPTITFDFILQNKIGYGYLQFLSFLVAASVAFADGCEMIIIPFLNLVLEKELGLTKSQQSFLSSIVFIGMTIGSMCSGFWGDLIGRKKTIQLFAGFIFLAGFASGLSWNLGSLFCFRGLFGFGIGNILPVTTTYLVEICPINKRGGIIIIFLFFFAVGELCCCGFAYLILKNLDSGNWKLLLIVSSIPMLVSWLFSFNFLNESPRYLLIEGRYDEGIQLINKLIFINKSKKWYNSKQLEPIEYLSQDEIEQLTTWSQQQKRIQQEENQQKLNFLNMIHSSYRSLSINLWIIWFVMTLVYYGTLYVIPPTIKKYYHSSEIFEEQQALSKNKQFGEVTFSVISEFPSYILSALLIEKHFFGRKKSLIYTSLLTGILSLIVYFIVLEEKTFILITSLQRFFLSIAFAVIFPYTCELYPTKLRNSGIGLSNAFSRLGGICMPWIIQFSWEVLGIFGPFFIFGLTCLVAAWCSFQLPYDTTGKELDLQNQIEIKKISQPESLWLELEKPKNQISKLNEK